MITASAHSSLPIECRVERHDQNQLELRLAYHPSGKRKHHDYWIELFMFLPRNLGVDARSYPALAFYNDTTGFLRLKTTPATLPELGQAGPFHGRVFEASTDSLAQHRLKLLGCIYRSALRRAAQDLDTSLQQAHEPTTQVAHIDAYLSQSRAALATLWAMEQRITAHANSAAFLATWKAVDEYIALYAEHATTRILKTLDAQIAREGGLGRGAARRKLAEFALAQYHRRKARGYQTTLGSTPENERFPYRTRILKRTLSSALYLEPKIQAVGNVTNDLIAMLAAGPAMLFAMLIAMWAQVQLKGFTSTFVLVMVVSYMLKDRIKDWVKRILGKRVSRWMPDRQFRVQAPGGNAELAICRDVVRYQPFADLPQEVRDLRFVDHGSPWQQTVVQKSYCSTPAMSALPKPGSKTPLTAPKACSTSSASTSPTCALVWAPPLKPIPMCIRKRLS